MRTNVIVGILAVTAITSIIYLFGVLLLYSDGASSHAVGNVLTLSRLWQLAAVPILVYFVMAKRSPRFLVVPLVLIALFAWPFVESALGWPLVASSRNLLFVGLNAGLALYATALILMRESVPRAGAPQPRRVV